MLFIFDENYSHYLADGLNLLEGGNDRSPIRAGATHILTLTKGVTGIPDEEVIEIVGKHKGILFTKDKDFKQIKHYYQLYKQHNIGVVFFESSRKPLLYWDYIKIFIEKWEDLKILIDKETAPFAIKIPKQGGAQKLSF